MPQLEGHEYIGSQLAIESKNKVKGYSTIIEATVIGWLPAEQGEPELFKIEHDLDKDMEDLDAAEVVLGFEKLKKMRSLEEASEGDGNSNVEQAMDEWMTHCFRQVREEGKGKPGHKGVIHKNADASGWRCEWMTRSDGSQVDAYFHNTTHAHLIRPSGIPSKSGVREFRAWITAGQPASTPPRYIRDGIMSPPPSTMTLGGPSALA